MRNLTLALFTILYLLMLSCDKQTTNIEAIEQPVEETRYYISFKVTCWKSDGYNPHFCNVEIFKNDVRKESGGTSIHTGWYASLQAYYLPTDKAKIILRDIVSKEIIFESHDLTQSTHPTLFVDSYEKRKNNDPSTNGSGHIYVGTCN